MNSTIHADSPHLTLVPANAQSPSQTAQAFDPLRFLQAMVVSLELDQVLGTLSGFLHDLIGHSGWEYHHATCGYDLSGGRSDRHRLEYDLTLNGESMGTLRLMRGRRFSESEQMRIESLLGLAAAAIHNALRFMMVTRQLERDPLTGLGNRRALELQGKQWLSDSLRHAKPFSMLVMDLDHFKEINDRYGHPMGDRLLCAVAKTLSAMTRAGDLCIRIGGDEFVVLLPGTDLAAAMDCADRLRTAIARQSVEDAGSPPLSVQASIGVAVHREGMDLDRLYDQADQALYAAKRSGSNRVVACVSE